MSIRIKDKTTQRQILDATRNLLFEEGIANLSIRKIAKSVGCSVGKIYCYFENKDDIIHSLMDEGFGLLIHEQEVVAKAVKNPQERLRALATTYMNFAQEHPKYYEIMFMMKADEISRYPAEKFRRARQSLKLFAQALKDGSAEGIMSVSDPYFSANVFWSLLHGAIALIHARRLDTKIEIDRFLENVVTIAIGTSSVIMDKR
jgi:AcrR family transcriptional regulator